MDAFLVDSVRIERVKAAAVDGEIQAVTPPLEYRFLEEAMKIVAPDGSRDGRHRLSSPATTGIVAHAVA